MKTYDPNIPNYSKLYYNVNKFNNFDEISENNVYEILEMVNHFKGYNKSVGYSGYQNVINYLTNPCNYKIFDFDTKILFLILCCDPQLVHFHTFIRTNIISIDEIKGLKYEEEIETAKMARNSQFKKLEEDIRYQIDFYDPNLINLEFSFFKKFYSDKMLLDNIKLDMMRVIHNLCANHLMLKEISNKEIAYLLTASDNYITYISDKKRNLYVNTVAFNTVYQGEILRLFNSIQKLFFFISTIDRKCNAANLFAKSSKKETIDEIESLIGFYDEKFIEAEKTYQKIMNK